MWCAACRGHPQLGAQPEWIGGITGIRWHKIARHQKCGTHAVSLALWSSGGRVWLRDVAGDAEAATLNGVHLIEAYRCHRAVAEILQHIAMDVRIGDAQPVTQAPYLALTFESCTDRSAKKEELLYLRFPQGNKIDTQFFSLQALGAGDAKSIVRAYKAVFEHASVPLELWVRRLVWLCTDGANVMTGTKAGVVVLGKTKFGPQPGSMVHSPSPVTPSTPRQCLGKPT